MTVLISQAIINDPGSAFHGKKMDLVIESGVIKEISKTCKGKFDQEIKGEALTVSPGWVDLFALFGDPGLEYKETLESGAAAAAAGGFTDVFLLPNNKPVTDNKSQVEYLLHRSSALPITVHPIGALTQEAAGKELAEMYDMQMSGAVAFSDGLRPVQSSGILVKALQYVKVFNGVVIQIPDDKSIAPHGLMHEGIHSTRYGLAGKPILAEELMVDRDIQLARYAGSRIHFTGVTSSRSLEYIRQAKKEGLSVSCSVTPYHLSFTDEDLLSYDTQLKVSPPLRSKKEVTALKKALTDGTIDCIATHHLPHEQDSKMTEFEYAAFGMIGLETCYPALRTAVPEISEEKWVDLLSLNARKIFGLPKPSVAVGQPASLTLYDPEGSSEVTNQFFRSRSRNSAFLGKTLKGQVLGTYHKGQLTLR